MGLIDGEFEYEQSELEEMEMPTPCQKCGEWFDLHDGYGSKKWFPKTTICESCHELEEDEITIDEEIEELKETITEAQDTISTAKEKLKELGIEISLTGVELIASERFRQLNELGYTYDSDSLYADGQLARAGATYATPQNAVIIWDGAITSNIRSNLWPWDAKYYKPTPENRIRELQKAGALIAAQIDYELAKINKDESTINKTTMGEFNCSWHKRH